MYIVFYLSGITWILGVIELLHKFLNLLLVDSLEALGNALERFAFCEK